MNYKITVKKILKTFIKYTPFNLTHIGGGDYIKSLSFFSITKALSFETFINILDAGCGDGHHALNLTKRFQSTYVTGLYISGPTEPITSMSNLLFLSRDLLQALDTLKYDFIYSVDVLDHIPNNIIVIKNFYNALKNGGYLYIHMPDSSPEKRIFPEELFFDFDRWEEKEHIGETYTLEELEAQLRKLGFIIIESGHTFGFLGELAWEIDIITDKKMALKIILMPFLKLMAQLSIHLKPKKGGVFCLLKKP